MFHLLKEILLVLAVVYKSGEYLSESVMKEVFEEITIDKKILDVVTGYAQETCPTGWNTNNGMCYYFSSVENQLTWSNADSWCQKNNGHLVSFLTLEERVSL